MTWYAQAFEKNGGILSFYDFMKLALYDPQYGYYMQLREVGAQGDFVTAPTLTPVFAEVLAAWVGKQWEALGRPEKWGVLEYGAGTGVLLKALRDYLGTSKGVVWWGICEISTSLGAVQQQALGDGVVWVNNVGEVPMGMPLVVIGNEVLDAFPVHQYWLEQEGWCELSLDSRLRAQLVPVKPPALPEDWEPELGAIFEDAPDVAPWLDSIVQRLERYGGAVWFADYGYVGLPPEGGDTLQAVQAHKQVALNHEPGKTDLTAHVDFARVLALLERGEVEDMGVFLIENGLLDLAAKIAGDTVQESAVRRLIHPAEMGALFKVVTALWEVKA